MKKDIFCFVPVATCLAFLSCTNIGAKEVHSQQEFTEYVVIERTTYQWKDLQHAVNAKLKGGYKLVGGVSSDGKNLYQAMAK